ncbi:MAG: D-alanyl-D-alanine carboxypeptidase [Acidobacteriota bacterium]|nr:D-alanyl-D-alanine carboxypeptidase [Acidobacteriota bacterium]
MKFRDFKFNRAWRNFAALALVFLMFHASSAQSTAKKPLFQDIRIPNGAPDATPTPGVKRTGSSSPINAPVVNNGMRTSIPALSELEIPGYSGVLVESLDGRTVLDSYSSSTFNPASNVKVATAYAVLRTFGVNYRFRTDIWTDGQIDPVTGTLNGNLYVSGRDPIFNLEHAVRLAHELNQLGVNNIDGDLIVTDNFAMNYSPSSKRSGYLLNSTLDGTKRSSAAAKAWQNFLLNSGEYKGPVPFPSVSTSGDVYVEGLPTNARLLFSHESAPLREIMKVTLSYSNNFLSERLGDMLGGAYAVARIVQMDARVPAGHFSLQTCSGLGINRVTPRAQMRLLRTFRSFLERNKMSFADVMPVAGLDDGTLRGRFNELYNLGSVVGKTGTLGRTDGGVSTLSGQIKTRNGTYLFVIFNQKGSVYRFRSFQNSFVPLVQGLLGGASKINYVPVSMDRRLAKTRITHPRGSRGRMD